MPGLFGLPDTKSNRDFSKREAWGKNVFNSSFPVALLCYMESIELKPYYIYTDRGQISNREEPLKSIFGVSYTDINTFFRFESHYEEFSKIVRDAPKMDLITVSRDRSIRGLEIKLTAVPDLATSRRPLKLQGPEIVIRQPTIKFLAASICNHFKGARKADLRKIVGHRFQNIRWEEEQSFLASFMDVKHVLIEISRVLERVQTPLILQPIWRTVSSTLTLDERCFDVAVWSDAAFLNLILSESSNDIPASAKRIDRTIAWLGVLISKFVDHDYFSSIELIAKTTYGPKNDKAFALGGNKMNRYLPQQMITNPRINRAALRNIILDGGELYLAPERRLDAAILGTWGNL